MSRSVNINSLEPFTRGTSRQTWFAQYCFNGDKTSHRITIRTDHPGGSGDPTPLDQEYFIYERLGKSDLPIATALWWEDDPMWTPRPFYIRKQISGNWNIENYNNPNPQYDAVRLDAAKEHIRKLAMVHTLDWKALGLKALIPAPISLADAAPCYIRTVFSRLEDVKAEPLPILLEVREMLLKNAPKAPRLSLCKGTNGFGEEVFENGRIVALSDWEEVAIGDPASDLAMVQGFLTPIIHKGNTLWDLNIALEFYKQQSGITIPPASLQYYQLVRLLGRAVMFSHTASVVAGNPNATVRQSWTATEVQSVTKRVLIAALGLGTPIDSARFEELNQSIETVSP